MDDEELKVQARINREVFERVLAPYVALKIENAMRAIERGSRNAWLDASGCVWCIFDDQAFMRSGNEARERKESHDDSFELQVYWSMGDIVMPHECTEEWVAQRIVEEAKLQLRALGFHRRRQIREVDGERHIGVLFSKKTSYLR